ncbi:hypothetical protein GA0074694_0050 [Micromonospora inyonensis]|uniref:Uncharacterized protein n=1 Tax=Micromonospora inyonensis TaxID=47866 RepID=A0A1C6R7G4_9ACTN|nr:hypothetical protein GA0074694_0050 [Micromonospora inyonensis]
MAIPVAVERAAGLGVAARSSRTFRRPVVARSVAPREPYGWEKVQRAWQDSNLRPWD